LRPPRARERRAKASDRQIWINLIVPQASI